MMGTLAAKIYSGIKKRRNLLINIAKFTIAVTLIYFLVTHLNPSQIYSDMKKANKLLISFALLLLGLNVYLQYVKWELICKQVLGVTDKRKIWLSLFYGFSAGISTPMRLGEYVGRAIPFKDKNLLEITFATFVDKIFPIFMVLFIGSVATIIFLHYYFNVAVYVTVSLFLVIFISLYLLLLIFSDSDFWDSYLYKKVSNIKIFNKYIEKFQILKKVNKVTLRKVTVYSFLFYLTYIFQFAILFYAFSGSFDFVNYIWIGSMVMFAKKFISFLTFGDLGIREATAVYFAGLIGISETAAFNASIIIFVINLVLPSLVGLFLFLRRN